MATLTRVSSAHTTVVPAALRHEIGLEPGAQLEWELHGDELRARRQKHKKLRDLIGFVSYEGDAVRDADSVHEE